MHIILVSENGNKKTTSIDVFRPAYVLPTVFAAICVIAGLLYGGFWFGANTQHRMWEQQAPQLRAELMQQRQEISQAKQLAESQLDVLAMRVGRLQAHVFRLEGLGKRLTEVASLDGGEFDFSSIPGQGGPQPVEALQSADFQDFILNFDQLSAQLDDREQQLALLESMVMSRSHYAQATPAGKPVKNGWLSSHYGQRTDPFTGKKESHYGMDFAGKKGSEIIAVAAGVVTWSGRKSGYGRLVEINHGNHYVTRYAHNDKNLVQVGETVKKGQAIALMGSSGRSTGPHVHFEVRHKGKVINPKKLIATSK